MPCVEYAKIYATGDNDLRYTCQPHAFEPLRSGVMDATMHRVENFIGREVNHADKLPGLSQLFHCGAAHTIRVENDGFVSLRSEEHTSELQSRLHLVCRLLLEKKKKNN